MQNRDYSSMRQNLTESRPTLDFEAMKLVTESC